MQSSNEPSTSGDNAPLSGVYTTNGDIAGPYRCLFSGARFLRVFSDADKDCDRYASADGWSDPVSGAYSPIFTRDQDHAYLYTWFPHAGDIVKAQLNLDAELFVDPCGYFKRRFDKSWGLGPVRSIQLQHMPVEWLLELDSAGFYTEFFRKLMAYDFIGRSCSMHGLLCGDRKVFTGEPYPIEPLPDLAFEVLPDDRVWPSELLGFEVEPYLYSDEGMNLSRNPLHQQINKHISIIREGGDALDGDHLLGARQPLPPAGYCEQVLGMRWPRAPESVPADFRGETLGDGTSFFLDPKTLISGASPTAASEWGEFSRVYDHDRKGYWHLARSIDNARYPLATLEDGDAFTFSGDRVEPDVDRRPDFRRSVPGTYDCDYARATYAAVISSVRPRWFRKIQGLPPKWRVLPPLRHLEDPRLGFLMVWGRQPEFRGVSDVPSYGRSEGEHLRALHLEAAIMRIIAMGVAGRIPLPAPEVIAAVLGTSVFYDRLRASGWWWFLPPAKGAKVAPLVVRIMDLSLVAKDKTVNECVVDPGPERRVFVFDARRCPKALEANPIRFSELKWFFYIGFVVAARLCDMPYCFSVDSGTGGCRLKVHLKSSKDDTVEQLEAATYWLPELQNQALDILGGVSQTSEDGPQLARDTQAYLGFEKETRYIAAPTVNCPEEGIIRGPICGRHRVDDGYQVNHYEFPDASDNPSFRNEPPLVTDDEAGDRDDTSQPNLDALSAIVENLTEWGIYSRVSK
jgi:hypothetical protein